MSLVRAFEQLEAGEVLQQLLVELILRPINLRQHSESLLVMTVSNMPWQRACCRP